MSAAPVNAAIDTVPPAERRKLQTEAWRHGCDTVAELVTAPTTGRGGGSQGFDPRKAGRN